MEFMLLDVFANEKYKGNPLAVFFCENQIDKQEMQKIAYELHFSESSFVFPREKPDGGYDVRIFTPDVELPFAGHPSLGSAFAISKKYNETGTIKINLPCGQIPVEVYGSEAMLTTEKFHLGKIFTVEETSILLGIQNDDIDHSFPIQIISSGLPALAIPLKSIDALERCCVNSNAFSEFIAKEGRVNLFPFINMDNTIHSRCFMDDPGFLEDPATGSAHIALGGYLAYYSNRYGKCCFEYTAIQGREMGREASLRIAVQYHRNSIKASVAGNIIMIASGEWI